MTINAKIDNLEFIHYLQTIKPDTHPILNEIIAFNSAHNMGTMMMSPIQMQLLCWLARLVNTKHYLEVGVFTGYSSTHMALNLPSEAKLYLCDINVTYTDIAKEFWEKAAVLHKMQLYLQPAFITLQELLAEGKVNFFQFILLDGDKEALAEYVDYCLPLLANGGIIAIDNTYLKGKVVAEEDKNDSASLIKLRSFNRNIFQDKRFDSILLPIGDGLTLLVKKEV